MSWNLNVTILHDVFLELTFVMEIMIVGMRRMNILGKDVPNPPVVKMNSGILVV